MPITTRSSTKGPVIFEPISHPILESVDPADAVKFNRDRERYELEIEQKEKDGHPMQPASYRVSVDRQVLKSMFEIGYFDTIAPNVRLEALTDEHIKKCIDEMANAQSTSEPDSNTINSAIDLLKMNMTIRDARARVFQLAVDFDAKMEEVGYSEFKSKNPKMAAKLFSQRLYPKALKSQILCDFEFVPQMQSDWKFFLKYVATQAEHIDKGHASLSRAGVLNKPENGDKNGGKEAKNRKGKARGGSRASSSGGTNSTPKDGGKNLPPCLNPECEKKHYLRDCKDTPDKDKPALYRMWRDKKQKASDANGEKKTRHVKPTFYKDDSLIETVFANVETRPTCPDMGSCINLMPPDLLASLLSKGARMKVEMFDVTRKYEMAVKEDAKGAEVFVECDRQVTLDIQLKIRHGSSLTIRNVIFYVSTKSASDPLLSKGLLKALGLDAKEALLTACDKYEGSVDASELCTVEEYATGSIARLLSENGVFHSDHGAADYEQEDDSSYLELGEDTEEEIQEAFDKLVKKASENGMKEPSCIKLRKMLRRNRDVFRIRLGNDPPAKVEPMKVKLNTAATPSITKARRYTQEQRSYMSAFIKRATEYGFIKENKNATWAAAPLLVVKPNSKNYRLTFDYRPVNAATITVSWPMPHIDSECTDFSGSKFFASMDFCSGFWQLPLHEESQKLLSFITNEGIFCPTRTAQGAKNSSINFQSRVEPCFATLRDHLKAWQDDFILHESTEDKLLDIMQKFFDICRSRHLKVSAVKSELFSTSVKWCGRIIDESGVKFDPRNLSGIREMTYPETAGELSQYVHCLQWMSHSIPDFANRTAPLRELIEAAYKHSGKRTTRSIKNIPLSSLSWGPKHEVTFNSLQESLRQAVKLSHPNPKKEKCVYTDASETHWAAVVTQCDQGELQKPVEEQRYEPLAFLSSSFKDSELHWSTFEKEGFAIYQTFQKLDYLLLGQKSAHLYTDHRNLLFVFNPLGMEPAIGRHIVNKVQRWALYLSRFHYTIEHVAGEKNVMADIMTRWYAGYRRKAVSAKVSSIRGLLMDKDIVSSPFSNNFIWPTAKNILQSQKRFGNNAPPDTIMDDEDFIKLGGKTWIPSEDNELQLKLLVISHCGTGGHRGKDATYNTLKERYFWDTMKEDSEVFVRNCIHCILSRGGERVPRPLGWNIIATRPNEILHFDFLAMGRGIEGKNYILLLRDGLSSYIWLWPAASAEADEVSKAISRWIDVFTAMDVWVSDQGSHFKNTVIKLLAGQYRINHHFVTAYSPWSNGSIERCCREVLRAATAILSELRLAPQDWPSIVNIIQKVLNESPLRRLGKNKDGNFRTPLEVMTGLKPCRTNLAPSVEYKKAQGKTMEEAKCSQLIKIDDLQGAMDDMHKDVFERIRGNRAKEIKAHNRKTNLTAPQFEIGDFVLVRRAQDKGHKLSFKWQGPMRITRTINPLVYEVTSLVNNKSANVHAIRIKLYRNDLDGQPVSRDLLSHAVHTEACYEDIHAFRELKKNGSEFLVRVEWEGLPDEIDHTWETLNDLNEDVPQLLREYLLNMKTAKAKQALSKLSN